MKTTFKRAFIGIVLLFCMEMFLVGKEWWHLLFFPVFLVIGWGYADYWNLKDEKKEDKKKDEQNIKKIMFAMKVGLQYVTDDKDWEMRARNIYAADEVML